MSVHPAGAAMDTDEGVTAMEATSTSFAAVPDGFVIVKVPVVVAAEAAARNAGVRPAAVADEAARNVTWAETGPVTSARTHRARIVFIARPPPECRRDR